MATSTTILTGGSWSYSGDPTASTLDEVRFWLSDTDPALALLSDVEVGYLINRYYAATGSALYVAAVGAEVLAAKFATEVSVSADGVSVSTSELFDRFQRLAESLRDQFKAVGGPDDLPGGPLLTGIWSVGSSFAIPPLMFGTGFNDNMEAGKQDYGDYSPGEGVTFFPDEWGTPGESTP